MTGFVWRGCEKHNHQQGPVHGKQDPVDCSPFVLAWRLWLRNHPLPSSGESMRAYPPQGALPAPTVERPDEARLALRRAVQATLAGFAEVDGLLDRAEQLISYQRPGYAPQGMVKSPSVPSAEARRSIGAAQAEIDRTSGRPARL